MKMKQCETQVQNFFLFSDLNSAELISHPVMQQLQVFRAGEPQSDLGGAARVHAGPDSSTQERAQQLQWPSLREHVQDSDGIKHLAVAIQEVHSRHPQVSVATSNFRLIPI